jgi:hypothetical protein
MKTYEFSPSFYQAYKLDNGNWVFNYTCGFSYIYAPFFFIGHLWAILGGYAQDGFSFPYQFMVAHGLLLCVLPGIYFLRRVLLEYFTDIETTVTIFFLVLGTNYFHESFNDYIQPHAVLFTAYAILLYLTQRWHKNQELEIAILMAILMAWMILSRPSEILCLLIPLFWGVYDKQSFILKFKLLTNNWRQLGLMVLAGFMVGIPQLLYWKTVTGNYLFYSYQQTEGFDFDGRYLFNVLFSFKKSWFVYTPIIIFPIIGLFILKNRNRMIYVAILLFILTNFYLLASWAAWWNGGSFGMRYFVESYAVMAIPWAYVNRSILKSNILVKFSLFAVMLGFVLLNLFQTWQYTNWIIPADRMTKEYYKRIFLKTKVTEEDRSLMEVERSYAENEMPFNSVDYNVKTIGYFDFDSLNSTFIEPNMLDTTFKVDGKYSMKVDKERPYSATLSIPHHLITHKDHAWIRASVYYLSPVDMKESPLSLVITYDHEGRKSYKYRGYELEKYPNKPGEWNFFTVDWMTPFPYDVNDPLKVYIWNRGDKPIYIDKFKIEAFEHK